MKMPRNLLIALSLFYFTGCGECSIIDDSGNPDRLVRLVGANGENLWFGDSVHYNPEEVVFEHETEGVLDSEPEPASQAVRLEFPATNTTERNITMRVDSVTSYSISYNTLVYEQKCTRIYELSFVKFEGEQVCSDCGTEVIELRVD